MDNNYNHGGDGDGDGGGDGDGRRSLSFGRRGSSNSQGRTISNNNGGRSTGRGIVPRGIVDGTRERGEREGERGIPQDCATSNYSRLLHDQATWKFLQDTYSQTTVDNNSNDDEYSRRKKRFSKKPSGFTVDVIVKDDGYRGRSVYANQFIQQGTKIWNSIHLVSFQTPKQFQSFLFNLDSRSKSNVRGGLNKKKNKIDINVHDLQCDILLWSYVEKGEGYVSLALDDGSFVNHGETSDVINLDQDCSAIRDIEIGEELLENYTEFIGFKEIKWFDEIRGNAWKEPSIQKTVAKSTDTYNKFGAPKLSSNYNYNQSQNQNGGAIIIDYTTSTIDYYTDINVNPKSPKAVMVLFSIIGMIIIFVYYAMKKLVPYHFFRKKEKDGI